MRCGRDAEMHVIDLKVAQKQNGISQQLIHEVQKRLDRKRTGADFLKLVAAMRLC